MSGKDLDVKLLLRDAIRDGESLDIILYLWRRVKGYKDDFLLLHTAIITRRLDVVKLLLNNGADPDSILDDGNVATHTAATIPFGTGILEELVVAGSDINHVNNLGETPLHLAVSSKSVETVRFIVTRTFIDFDKINTRDKDGQTALFRAANLGCFEIVKLLVENGADPNIQDFFGLAPLHKAVMISSEIVTLLVMNGADIHLKSNSGTSPADIVTIESDNSHIAQQSMINMFYLKITEPIKEDKVHDKVNDSADHDDESVDDSVDHDDESVDHDDESVISIVESAGGTDGSFVMVNDVSIKDILAFLDANDLMMVRKVDISNLK